jgi:Initiator Replication protein/DnaA N-terminal domain
LQFRKKIKLSNLQKLCSPLINPLENPHMQPTLFPLDTTKKVELVKHTAAIHIKASLSLVDRKVLNVLLKNAYDEIGKEKYHTIRLAEIKNLIGWEGKNYVKLKTSLRKLVNTKIEWNIFGKDKKNQWFISSLLASASIAGGKCTYDYPFHLQGLLKNPNIYGRINLLIQNNFKSKYSLILWEYLINHLANAQGSTIGTEWIKISDYRNLMGIEDGVYCEFKELSYNLIKNPVREINKVSEIEVEAKYQKEGNSIVAVRFIAQKIIKKGILKTPEEIKESLLNFCNLSPIVVDKIIEQYPQDQIIANIAYIEAINKKGLINNIASYSFNAIKNDLRLPAEEAPKKQTATSKPEPIIKINNKSAKWKTLNQILKENFENEIFEKWLTKLNFIKLEKGNLHLATAEANGKFQRDWIIREYQSTMLHHLQEKGVSSIRITYLET